MNATIKTYDAGNMALEQHKIEMPIEAAKKIVKTNAVEAGPESYWESVLVKPTRRASKAKASTVTIWTAGFGTSEIANAIQSVGCDLISE
jgi:hypothetical protein